VLVGASSCRNIEKQPHLPLGVTAEDGGPVEARRSMTTTDNFRYRGYEIVPRREWSQWCVSVYPMRADLPILTRSTLRALRPGKKDALDAARKRN
jgi:hypothetical protein